MWQREKLLFLIPSGTAKGVRKDVSCSLTIECGVVVSMATSFFLFIFFSLVQQLNTATIKGKKNP